MITATVIALLVLPLVMLRRRTLVVYYATDLATWLFVWILWRRVPGLDPRLGFTAIAVLKLATFSIFVACGRDVRWSPNRAAIVAAIVYGLAIPAMLPPKTVVDGDEPYYLLITESIVRDRDLDLANQYATLERSATGRRDLVPQFGDPTGPNGERYSRHEPFLSLLMAPGYAIAGLWGAIATMALFGVLLVRSTMRWFEDEGISEAAARAVFPLFAFGPPVLFYAARIWPEVPAAFFFVETLRGMRNHRMKRWLPALFGLVMLKLRFVLVAIGLVAVLLVERRASARRKLLALATLIVPLLIMWLVTGSATSVHSWREVLPAPPERYVTGFFGLLTDGMSGIPFQAPFYLFGLAAILRWRSMPRGFRLGALGGALYVLYLLPRPEWFGGWAPPLRYVVFLMPVLALGAAAMWDRLSGGTIAIAAAWTVGLVIHGLAFPWRLFHIANGENAVSEWLSRLYGVDFSRVFPSFIRMNDAAWVGVGVVLAMIVLLATARERSIAPVIIAAFALVVSVAFLYARQPASHVELEDAHVVDEGTELYPPFYTLMRVAYRGGRILDANDSLTFLAREGNWTLHAITGLGATFELGGHAYRIEPDPRYQTIRVRIPRSGPVTLRCVSGAINVDRMERDE